MNLLIVDDEVITIKGMMNGIDWKACGIDGKMWTAYSAESALKILNTQEIHLMLCDIEMSGDNGIDLLRSIRGINKEIACIFLTCHANFEYAQDAISLGCSDYILKPAPYEVIAERVKKVCAGLQRRLREQELVKYGSRELSGPEEGMEPGKGSRSAKEIVRQTEEYIQQHLSDSELLVSGIAEEMFLNKDYLNRVFKKAHGISISQYLIQERMRLAALLLKEPKANVNQVAEKVGYQNYPYFASSFKRCYGCSPMQYKKEHGGDEE